MERQTTIVLATGNKGKIAEIQDLLVDFPVSIKYLNDFGPIPPVVEDGDTFEENAYKKASQVARVIGLPALADDSGLCVTALGGLPGVRSARYGGKGLDDMERSARLLKAMAGKNDWTAFFECVISIAVPTGQALTYEARCEGLITQTPAGDNGFGYDPIFYYPPLQKTFAQLNRKEKSRISHRGKAFSEFRSEFDKVLTWIRMHMPEEEKFICKEGDDD
ncbi:MAG: XTP/dITP diphosphatase [Thermodesulfobacteriota bacterium]|nr:XTP/dITP diphosphatase [Thermodesulfobacteriota bacterium]